MYKKILQYNEPTNEETKAFEVEFNGPKPNMDVFESELFKQVILSYSDLAEQFIVEHDLKVGAKLSFLASTKSCFTISEVQLTADVASISSIGCDSENLRVLLIEVKAKSGKAVAECLFRS